MTFTFPTLFPFGISVLSMRNYPIVLTSQTHFKCIMNLDELKCNFSKHYLFSIFMFNIIQIIHVYCLRGKKSYQDLHL
jgi:hypothetical protein